MRSVRKTVTHSVTRKIDLRSRKMEDRNTDSTASIVHHRQALPSEAVFLASAVFRLPSAALKGEGDE